MPTTIAEVFAAVGLVQDGIESARWGAKPTTSRSGVYLISLTESFDSCNSKLISRISSRRGISGRADTDEYRPKMANLALIF